QRDGPDLRAAAVDGPQDAAGREVVGAQRAGERGPAVGDGERPVGGHRQVLDPRRVPVAGRPEPQCRTLGERVIGGGVRGGAGGRGRGRGRGGGLHGVRSSGRDHPPGQGGGQDATRDRDGREKGAPGRGRGEVGDRGRNRG